MKNWHLAKIEISAVNAAWLAGFLLMFWAPLWGEHRLPTVLLLGLGLWLQYSQGDRLGALPAVALLRRMLAILALAFLVGLPNSAEPQGTAIIGAALALYYWVGLALVAGLASEQRLARMGRWLGWLFLFWCVDGLVQLAAGVDLFGVPLKNEGRVVGLFGDNLRMAVIMAVTMPIVLWPLAGRRPLLAVAALALFTLIIGLSGARTSLVFVGLVGLGLWLRLPGRLPRLALVACVVAAIASAFAFSPSLRDRLIERGYEPLVSRAAAEDRQSLFEDMDRILSLRLTIWDTAANMFAARPISGVGAGAFDEAYDTYAGNPDDPFRTGNWSQAGPYHAHQLYISLAAETGLIGLAAFLAVVAMGIRWYRRLPEHARNLASPYAWGLLAALFPLNSQHPLFIGWWFTVLLFLLCGMLAAGSLGDRREKP